jgi:hypothetical protein
MLTSSPTGYSCGSIGSCRLPSAGSLATPVVLILLLWQRGAPPPMLPGHTPVAFMAPDHWCRTHPSGQGALPAPAVLCIRPRHLPWGPVLQQFYEARLARTVSGSAFHRLWNLPVVVGSTRCCQQAHKGWASGAQHCPAPGVPGYWFAVLISSTRALYYDYRHQGHQWNMVWIPLKPSGNDATLPNENPFATI